MLCRAMVLFLGWGLSTECVVAQPLHYIFFPQVCQYWRLSSFLLPDAHLYGIMKVVNVALRYVVRILNMYVILNINESCIAFI